MFELGVEVKFVIISIAVAVILAKFLFGPRSKAKQSTKSEPVGDVVKEPVIKADDLKNGEMVEAVLQGTKILVYREKDEFFATGAKCSHYGAPLRDGAFCNGKVRCPLHGATFDVRTGDIEDYPGPDCIPAFTATREGDDVVVSASIAALRNNRVQRAACKHESGDNTSVIVVGGGAAGHQCVQRLRELGYKGRIALITKEPHPPYDRPKLSKNLGVDVTKIHMRPAEWYRAHDIELILNTTVTEVNTKERFVRTSQGEQLSYTDVVVCTGGVPRGLPSPGFKELGNIFQLRTPEDARLINDRFKNARVAIVGSSFIGMEVASSIAAAAKAVAVIGMETVPFERVLGPQIGAVMQALHESKGVQFHMKRIVKEFRGTGGLVTSVVLDNDEVIECDLCVIGAGVVCQTDFVKGGEVQIERDGSIMTDRFMKAGPHIYVCGDIARYPYHLTGENIRVEHWGMAQTQGATAAHSIVGKPKELLSVPFFWTNQYNKMIRYCGHALSFDEILFEGKVEDQVFAAFYVRKNQITAVCSIGQPYETVVSTCGQLMANDRLPSGSDLRNAENKVAFLRGLLSSE